VTQEEIEIHNNVILGGEGKLTVDGNCDHRVLSVPEGEDVTAELSGFNVTRGASPNGGCIRNDGTLTLRNSTVSQCSALGIPSDFADSRGGGILNAGTLTVANSTVSGSSGSFAGGGVANFGTLTLTESTVLGNSAEVGGGIWNGNTFTITSSTVSGNTADTIAFTAGGGIHTRGERLSKTSSITNSSVSGNTGAGVYNQANTSTLTIANSTVSGNTEEGVRNHSESGPLTVTNSLIDGACEGAIISNGYNIESPGNTCGLDTNKGDQVNVSTDDLNLGPLQNNGGPTMTHALLTELTVSVAIDVIAGVDCVDAEGQPMTTDQRGQPRPAGPEPKECDVGSFEVQPAP
jgi:hypothetical protein